MVHDVKIPNWPESAVKGLGTDREQLRLAQPRTQASWHCLSDQRRLETECDSGEFDLLRHIRNGRGRRELARLQGGLGD